MIEKFYIEQVRAWVDANLGDNQSEFGRKCFAEYGDPVGKWEKLLKGRRKLSFKDAEALAAAIGERMSAIVFRAEESSRR